MWRLDTLFDFSAHSKSNKKRTYNHNKKKQHTQRDRQTIANNCCPKKNNNTKKLCRNCTWFFTISMVWFYLFCVGLFLCFLYARLFIFFFVFISLSISHCDLHFISHSVDVYACIEVCLWLYFSRYYVKNVIVYISIIDATNKRTSGVHNLLWLKNTSQTTNTQW